MFRIAILLVILASCGTEHYTQVIDSDEVCNKEQSEVSSSGTTTETTVTDDPIAGQLKIPVCESTTETE